MEEAAEKEKEKQAEKERERDYCNQLVSVAATGKGQRAFAQHGY